MNKKRVKLLIRAGIMLVSLGLWQSREINAVGFIVIFISNMLDIDVSTGSTD